MITLDVTLNSCDLQDLVLLDKNNNSINFSAHRIFPRFYRYQKLELITNDDLAHAPNRLNRSVTRWLIRDGIKNFSFIFHSLSNTYRLIIDEDDNFEFPLTVKDDGIRPWVARSCIAKGIRPTILNEFLEMYRSRNPFDFGLLVRDAYSRDVVKKFKLYESKNFQFDYENDLNPSNFQLTYSLYENSKVLHGRLAINNDKILQLSNKRLELSKKSPTFVEETANGYRVLGAHYSAPSLKRAIFLGNDYNLYHFLVECLLRLMAVPELEYTGIPLVMEKGTHPNLVEFARLLTGVEPVLLSPSESVEISELILCREHGVKDPIKVLERIEFLPELSKRIVNKTIRKLDSSYASKIFFRRKKRLSRPLQNENEIYHLLEGLGFLSCYPEDLTATEIVNLMQNCQVLVAEGGAALTNLMFMKPDSKLVQLIPAIGDFSMWKDYSSIFKIEYHQIIGTKKWIGRNGIAFDGYEIDCQEIINTIKNLL